MAKLRNTLLYTERREASDQNAGAYEVQVVLTDAVCDVQKHKTNPETGRTTTRVIRMHRDVWDALVDAYVRERKR